MGLSDCAIHTLTEGEGTRLLNVFVVCTLAGWAYGVYLAACYIKTLIFGLLF